MALYEDGDLKPIADLAPTDSESSAPAAGGASGDPPTGSACSPAALRKAIALGDEAFLESLAGKAVSVEGMLLKPPKTKGDLAPAEIMAGGGSLPVAFPPDTKAAALPMATRIVVSGEPAKLGGRWFLRIAGWGRAEAVESGQPLNVCSWPGGAPETQDVDTGE